MTVLFNFTKSPGPQGKAIYYLDCRLLKNFCKPVANPDYERPNPAISRLIPQCGAAAAETWALVDFKLLANNADRLHNS